MSFLNYHRCAGTVAMMYNTTDPRQFTYAIQNMVLLTEKSLPPGYFINTTEATVTHHETGRNEIVSRMVGDWLFMTDTDHTFAPDLLVRLLRLREKHKTQVLSAIYCRKYEPYLPVVANYSSEGKLEPMTSWDYTKEIIPVGVVGGGGLLINREVIDLLLDKYNTGPFTTLQGLSEDYSFCKRCHDQGIEVWLAPKVETHHLVAQHLVISVNDHFPANRVQAQP